MKNKIYILVLIIILGCNTDKGSDCFKTNGNSITNVYDLNDFSSVVFRDGIELELKQGTQNKIEITFGENLIDNVSTNIINNRLIIENNTNCNHIRNVTPAKVILTAKNITEIRNASQFQLFTKDTLRFENLQIISENFLEEGSNAGDVNVLVNNQSLSIVTNGASNFMIKGKTKHLNLNFAAGQGKFLGENLVAQNIFVFHRGANNLIIHPVKELKGEIRSSGNIIAVKKPPQIDVKEFYTGKLVFRD